MANSCKYYKQVLQVSYDSGVTWVNVGETRKGDLYDYESMQCGGGVTQYRWVDVTGQYTCDGTTKYQKTKKQYSNDGTTWQDVSPAEYGKGDVIEYQSEDCGYEPPSYSGEYLTFVAIDDGRFKFSGNSVQYSMDEGSTWSTLASDTYSPTVYAGQKIMWKGNLTPSDKETVWGIGKFSSTGRFNAEGNVMSLLYGDNFEGQIDLTGKECALALLFKDNANIVSAKNLVLPATILTTACYMSMFSHCTSLTEAPELPATTLAEQCYDNMFNGCTSLTKAPALPATTLAKHCYAYMFIDCTSLTEAPELSATALAHACYSFMFGNCTSLMTLPQLPATTLADFCYNFMFWRCTSLTNIPNDLLPATTLAEQCYYAMFLNCTSLTTVPELPATTLAYNCYNVMFSFCTSLTTAPELPATTLVEGCYEHMFRGSSKLNYIKCLATDISAENCTNEWLRLTSSTGTFVKNASMNDWTRGSSGIPNNWTVQNA